MTDVRRADGLTTEEGARRAGEHLMMYHVVDGEASAGAAEPSPTPAATSSALSPPTARAPRAPARPPRPAPPPPTRRSGRDKRPRQPFDNSNAELLPPPSPPAKKQRMASPAPEPRQRRRGIPAKADYTPEERAELDAAAARLPLYQPPAELHPAPRSRQPPVAPERETEEAKDRRAARDLLALANDGNMAPLTDPAPRRRSGRTEANSSRKRKSALTNEEPEAKRQRQTERASSSPPSPEQTRKRRRQNDDDDEPQTKRQRQTEQLSSSTPSPKQTRKRRRQLDDDEPQAKRQHKTERTSSSPSPKPNRQRRSAKQRKKPSKASDSSNNEFEGIPTGAGTTSNRPDDATNDEPWKCAYLNCDTGQTWSAREGPNSLGRKSISEFFGRNKKEALRIHNGVWHTYCRKDYQRSSYNRQGISDKAFALWKVKNIKHQLVRIKLWRPDATFKVQLSKAMHERLNEFHKLLRRNNDDMDAALQVLIAQDQAKKKEKGAAKKVKKETKNNKAPKETIPLEEHCPVDVAEDFDETWSGPSLSLARMDELMDWVKERIEGELDHMIPVEFLINELAPGETVNDAEDNWERWAEQLDESEEEYEDPGTDSEE